MTGEGVWGEGCLDADEVPVLAWGRVAGVGMCVRTVKVHVHVLCVSEDTHKNKTKGTQGEGEHPSLLT